MSDMQPTAGDSGASSSDPVDLIQNFLDGSEGSSDGQPEGEGKESSTTDDPKEGAQPKDSEPQFTTAHLAQFLGVEESMVDVDDDGAPVFKTKVDGKEQAAKFADFVTDYQKRGAADNRMREAAAKEQAAERKMLEADQAIQMRYQEAQANLQAAYQLNAALQEDLRGEYQSINWDALWQSDAAQARALERRFEQRRGRLDAVMQQIQQRGAHAQQQAYAQHAANVENARRAEAGRLTDLIPEWKDPATADKERRDILAWMESTGFDAREIDLNRASQVAMLRRVWQHDTLQKAKPAIEKMVRTAPKLVKPGQAQQSDGNTAMLKNLKQNVRTASKANSTKALAALLEATGQA